MKRDWAFLNVYVTSDDLAAAVDAATAAGREARLDDPFPYAVEYLGPASDPLEVIDATVDDLVEHSPSVFSLRPVHLCPLEEAPSFRLPSGVVLANGNDDDEVDELSEAFEVVVNAEVGWLTVTPDARAVMQRFRQLAAVLPSMDALEVQTMAHWNDTDITRVFLGPDTLRDAPILDYLDKNRVAFVDNGLVEVAIYARAARHTLRLTEHKTIDYIVDDVDDLTEVERTAWRAGLVKREALRSLAEGYEHFHYASEAFASRDAFESMLRDEGFVLVHEQRDTENDADASDDPPDATR